MSPRCLSQLRLAVVIVLLSFIPRMVRADGVQEARLAFEKGVVASREQRWTEARTQFRRSLELVPKPSTMFNLAVADIKLGLGREALEQLDAFEQAASSDEHSAMLERAKVMRPQAQALLESEESKAQTGGNALSQRESGLNEQMRREVERARQLYESGRDREALAAFEHAYKASKQPELLYNIGVVADRMRNDTRAIRAYEAFIAAVPDAPEAAVAQVRSEALREALLARENDAQPEREPAMHRVAPPTDQGAAAPLALPRTLLSTGAVLTAGAIGALVWFLDRKSAHDTCSSREGCENLPTITQQRNASLATTVVSGAAGVALITAGAVVLHQRKHANAGELGFAPAFSPRSYGLNLRYTF